MTALQRLTFGRSVTLLGQQLGMTTLTLWVAYHLDSFAGAAFVQSLPPLLALLLFVKAGSVADHHCHRKILVTSDRVASLCLIVIALGLAAFSWSMTVSWILIAFGYILYQASLLFFNPAAEALLSQIVEDTDRTQANSTHRGCLQVAAVTGQSISGFLYAYLGPVTLLMLNAVSVLFSVHIQQRLPETTSVAKPQAASAPQRSQGLAGLGYALGHPTLRHLIVFIMAANAFIAPAFLVLPFHFKDSLGAQEGSFGLALGLFTLGQSLGSFVLTPRLRHYPSRVSIIACTWILSSGLLALSLTGQTYAALAIVFLMGLSIAPIQILAIAEIQKATEAQYMGRVMSALMAASQILTPVFSVSSAFLLETSSIGAPLVLKLSALALALSSLVFWSASQPEHRTVEI